MQRKMVVWAHAVLRTHPKTVEDSVSSNEQCGNWNREEETNEPLKASFCVSAGKTCLISYCKNKLV